MADTSVMTPPRQINPGQACFVTVRAVNRSARFTPTRDACEAIEFCLAVTLARFRGRISLHEFLWMSNHFHLALTDVAGCLPAFMETLNSLLSRSLNALRGTTGTNIEKGYNLVIVHGNDRLLEHCVYTLANPCAAHLVARSLHWKGVSSLQLEYGEPRRVLRPRRGLWSEEPRRPRPGATAPKRPHRRRRSSLPEAVELVLERPAARLDLGDSELRSLIRSTLDRRESELALERRRNGRTALGWTAVVRASTWAVPRRPKRMFDRIPSASAEDGASRARAARIRRGFLARYRSAIERFSAGERDVSFPQGTWLMKQRFGVACSPLVEA
jgi:putative transposase